jgi:hypothetical protein
VPPVCSAFSRPAQCSDRTLRPGLLAALVLTALLASCQPLPHPFAEDRPPRELLAIPASAGVSIAPVEGRPAAIAAGLGAATARALLKHEIPASAKTIGRGSYRLYGGITQTRERRDRSAVAVLWRLDDAAGRRIGEREVRVEGTAEEWRSAEGAMIDRLAVLSAEAVARLLVGEPASPRLAALAPSPRPTEPDAAIPGPPPPKPPVPERAAARSAATGPPSAPPASAAEAGPPRRQENGRIRVSLRRVTGAPGDGATSLARAVTSVLRGRNLLVVDPGGKADFHIEGEVTITPIGSDRQHVKIVWRVSDASGAELGTVGQENDVPRGLLSRQWGDVAYVVAAAAGDGLMQVLASAPPPASPAAGSGAAAAAPEPSKAAPGRRTGAGAARAAAETAKTKGSRR